MPAAVDAEEGRTEEELQQALLESHEIDEHVHYSHRSPWLRAFVLGALDGLVSVACTIVGVSGGNTDLALMRLTGISAWVACALAMASGEYVSVASQKDCQESDVQKEKEMQNAGPEARQHELEELAAIYENRGLTPELAKKVAEELTAHDVIRAHARDELGIDVDELADPLQAALVSMLACTLGAAIPLLTGSFVQNDELRVYWVMCATAIGCLMFGVSASALGGAGIIRGGLRVLIGGCLSMAITFGVGTAFGVAVT
uniref:Uncharacterized protein n=1 Tax=Chlamydomonas euryale TaxID=1486919 RepID=A0A7R9YTY6_9CHLO|mmetsp:Transcript_22188/g.66183  ORF Transcript_22188/g.66183 Transcript_22188/m.66183 type:complete len:259 (+) Transcript_22188:151-927(+)